MPDGPGAAIALTARRSIAGIGVLGNLDRFLVSLNAQLGAAIPTTPRFIQAGPVVLTCLAPKRYVASADRNADLPAQFTKVLAGFAAITDQSDLWETFNLSGPLIRELLACLVPIDLCPSKFRVGDAVSTRAGHFQVRLWRLAQFQYELAVSRSYAGDLLAILRDHSCSQDLLE